MYWPDGKVGIYFGTGSNLYQNDLLFNAQQSMYGIFDDVANCGFGAVNAGNCAPIEKKDLINQTIASTGISDSEYYFSSNNNYADDTKRKGFYINAPTGYRIVTTPEVIKVDGRTEGAVVWNVEKLMATDKSSSAVTTCTPDNVSSTGFRLMVDAKKGSMSDFVSWGEKRYFNETRLIVSVPYSGSSSRNMLLTNNNDLSLSNHGTMQSGVLSAPKQQPQFSEDCRGDAYLISQTTRAGTHLNQISCLGKTHSVRRLAWREIF